MITINGKQWQVIVARLPEELLHGLSEQESLDVNTGMLFDMVYDQKEIKINMQDMLFPLDIIFINSRTGVIGVALNVEPKEDITFHSDNGGARYFLEVNAGEAEGIEVGDIVTLGIPTENNQIITPQFWSTLFAVLIPMVAIPVVTSVSTVAVGWLEKKGTELKEK